MVKSTGLVGLSQDASIVLKKILDAMPMDELRSYEKHRSGPGVNVMVDAEVIIQMAELQDKGWITTSDGAIFVTTVYLTMPAWERYQVAEWEEIEQEVLKDQRGSEFGRW